MSVDERGALTTTAAIIVLGRSLGPTGVIVGALAGAGVDALLLLTYLRTFVPIDVERIVIRPSLVCAVVTVTSLWVLQYSPAGALFVGLTLLTLGFLGCGIIRSDERKWIFRILARRPPSESN